MEVKLPKKGGAPAIPSRMRRVGNAWGIMENWIGDNGKEHGNSVVYWGSTGGMEKNVETTVVLLGLYRDRGRKMKTTIVL